MAQVTETLVRDELKRVEEGEQPMFTRWEYEQLMRAWLDREALRKALGFYADPTRYHGPNQRLDDPDEWSASVGLESYRLDVTRDQGVIARTVLGAV